MAFTVTARHSGATGQGSAQTLASSSAAPTADSLLLVFAIAQSNSHGTEPNWPAPSGGTASYVLRVTTWPTDTGQYANYRTASAFWTAEVGPSPSAHTVTIDPNSGSSDYFQSVLSCDVTGHSGIVRWAKVGVNTPYGDGHSGSVALPSAPTAGNLLLLHVGRSNDESAPASAPTMGSGKGFTQLFNQTEPYNSGGLWYRVADGTESPTVSVADLGQQVGAYTA